MKTKSFAVFGLGRFGTALATELCNMGHEVLAVDPSEERVARLPDNITHPVVGDPQDEHLLKTLGVRNFDCAIVASADEIQNSVLVTLMLKELGVKYVVAKAQNAMHMKLLEKIGADKVVFPERDAGQKLAQILGSANIIDRFELSDEYSIVEVNTPKSWAGRSIRDINARAVFGINIIAISAPQSGIVFSPNASYVLAPGEVLVVLGSNEDLLKIKNL